MTNLVTATVVTGAAATAAMTMPVHAARARVHRMRRGKTRNQISSRVAAGLLPAARGPRPGPPRPARSRRGGRQALLAEHTGTRCGHMPGPAAGPGEQDGHDRGGAASGPARFGQAGTTRLADVRAGKPRARGSQPAAGAATATGRNGARTAPSDSGHTNELDTARLPPR